MVQYYSVDPLVLCYILNLVGNKCVKIAILLKM